jgi:hypothetical protein
MQGFVAETWERDHLGDLGRIILKRIFRKQDQKAWSDGAEERDKRRAVVNIVTDFRGA